MQKFFKKNHQSLSASNIPTETSENKVRMTSNFLTIFKPMLFGHMEMFNPLLALQNFLNKGTQDRSLRAINKILPQLRELSYFKKLERRYGTDSLIACCQHMTYEFFPVRSFVFKRGDIINFFFVIIDGTVVKEDCDEEGHEVARGESFGEKSAVEVRTRNCSYKCKSDLQVAVIDVERYGEIIKKAQELKSQEIVKFLGGIPGLKELTPGYLQKLYYMFSERKYKKKQKVFKEGEIVNEVFIVKNGEFMISKGLRIDLNSKKHSKIINRHALIAVVSSGEMIGEDDAANDDIRTFSCSCESDEGTLLVISKEIFMKKIVSYDVPNHALTERIRLKSSLRNQLTQAINSVEHRKMGIEEKIETNTSKRLNKPKIPDILKARKLFSNIPHVDKNLHTIKIIEKELIRRESISPARSCSPSRRASVEPIFQNPLLRSSPIRTGLSSENYFRKRSSSDLPVNFHISALRDKLSTAHSTRSTFITSRPYSQNSTVTLKLNFPGQSTDRSPAKSTKRIKMTPHNMFRLVNL